LVFTILRHAEDFPWRMQDIGLMGLRLDDQREYRIHVWDPSYSVGDPPIHDHPYDFTSRVIAGELTNTLYAEDPAGDNYVRFRYSLGAEDQRRSDTVKLSATPETFAEDGEYSQLAHELHVSWQEPGTVTVIRCSWGKGPRTNKVSDRWEVRAGHKGCECANNSRAGPKPRELTVCLRHEGFWPSGQARDATRDEIKEFSAKALEWF
jgi:hypothetical protein